MTLKTHPYYGLALLNKPKGKTSFSLVSFLRKLTQERCIGHAGTLDPFATGLMVMLIGRPYTKLSNRFLLSDKAYRAKVHFGIKTDSYDSDGKILETSDKIPELSEIKEALSQFQGKILQTPPMFSAKKIGGKRLYTLARQGLEVERTPKEIFLQTHLLSYQYPFLELSIACSSGTYIRSIAHDLGEILGCKAHLSELSRTHIGNFSLEEAQDCDAILDPNQLKLRCSF